jgi:hypothetical protein
MRSSHPTSHRFCLPIAPSHQGLPIAPSHQGLPIRALPEGGAEGLCRPPNGRASILRKMGRPHLQARKNGAGLTSSRENWAGLTSSRENWAGLTSSPKNGPASPRARKMGNQVLAPPHPSPPPIRPLPSAHSHQVCPLSISPLPSALPSSLSPSHQPGAASAASFRRYASRWLVTCRRVSPATRMSCRMGAAVALCGPPSCAGGRGGGGRGHGVSSEDSPLRCVCPGPMRMRGELRHRAPHPPSLVPAPGQLPP